MFAAHPSPTVALTRRRALLLGALALTAGAPSLTAAAAAALDFPAQAQVGGMRLQLNGVGLRAVAWVKGYAAALYLAQPARSTEAVLADVAPKRLQLRLMLDVPAEEFAKAFDKGVRRNLAPEALPALAPRMAAFETRIRALGPLRVGELIDLDHLPGTGLQLSRNGREQGAPLAGDDLVRALLLVFLGQRPVDERLKTGLLAGWQRAAAS